MFSRRELRVVSVGLLFASGAASLAYEAVWLRRLGLLLGSSAVAAAVALGAFMGGLALGGALAARWRPRRPLWAYAGLEVFAAAWAVSFPALLAVSEVAVEALPWSRWLAAGALLLPPAMALGATWPVLTRVGDLRQAATLYAANTTGAVVGALGSTFVALPWLGVRGTELAAAGLGAAAALVALRWGGAVVGAAPVTEPSGRPAAALLGAGFAAGFAALGLEVLWFRLGAVGMGATVQTMGVVLATFLAAHAAGAWLGRTWPDDAWAGVGWGLGALGVLALGGAALWGWLPYGVAAAWRLGGAGGAWWATAALAAVVMGGAPVASGVAFASAVRCCGRVSTGALYAANAAGGVLGAIAGGLWLLPGLEARGAVVALALTAAVAGSVALRRPWPALAAVALAVALPAWDARLYAVGVYLRISDFADPSSEAIRSFADEGWDLLLYDHGQTGAVAVGRSRRTGNVWLSVNGKVDASTGVDMPTQQLSGALPLRMHGGRARDVLVVGLASGVTAGAVLAEDEVASLTVVELEPAVVAASRLFDHASGAPLDDPRTALVIDDARAFLQRADRRYDVIVSEPSNPWISGVSNLFTQEYWALASSRLAPGGVMCQWIQLYGMGPEELAGLVRTFRSVFPDAWLFETVEGADVLLIGGAPHAPAGLPLAPRLDPAGVARLGGEGWLNTDDRPRVEWQAPRYLHLDTGPANAARLDAAAAGVRESGGPP